MPVSPSSKAATQAEVASAPMPSRSLRSSTVLANSVVVAMAAPRAAPAASPMPPMAF